MLAEPADVTEERESKDVVSPSSSPSGTSSACNTGEILCPMRERERERERERQTETDRDRQTDRQTDRQRFCKC